MTYFPGNEPEPEPQAPADPCVAVAKGPTYHVGDVVSAYGTSGLVVTVVEAGESYSYRLAVLTALTDPMPEEAVTAGLAEGV